MHSSKLLLVVASVVVSALPLGQPGIFTGDPILSISKDDQASSYDVKRGIVDPGEILDISRDQEKSSYDKRIVDPDEILNISASPEESSYDV
ncbi:hypothetical protein B0I35DRAFT_157138 [Stachybotrys elegans]|uniref:Uncharacterized protein n=1 Tax=Stachybotrys elegans TaxID=80388 RepID=A0A8K0SYB5_9HYPO|nr:hypothetical protein B0I35DRAFT_157138 [Stachybotrys elegans]